MDKSQAIDRFWNRFLKAYDQNTVKEGLQFPYITYEVAVTPQEETALTASIWYKGTAQNKSWREITEKADEISRTIGYQGVIIPVDDGYIWIKRGNPFYQRMSDEDDNIRRIVLNIIVEYLTPN